MTVPMARAFLTPGQWAPSLYPGEAAGRHSDGTIVATLGDPGCFKTGRDFAAWLGLVPPQNSTGGKEFRFTLMFVSHSL